jgi:hypothetical protein
VKYTWNGDTNFSGTVDFDDYVRTDIGFNTGLTGWLNGDFDYSGSIDFDDYVLIDIAFNTQSGTLRRAIDYLSGADRTGAGGRAEVGVQMVIAHYARFGVPYARSFISSVPEPTTSLLFAAFPFALDARRRHRR